MTPAPPTTPAPLPAPEETTWGASGGDEAVCCEHIECVDGSGGGGALDYSLGSDVWRERAISVYDDGEILIHEPVDAAKNDVHSGQSFTSTQTTFYRLCDVPSQHWRNSVAHLSLCLAKLGVKHI